MMSTTEMITAVVLELVLVGLLYLFYCLSKRCGLRKKLLKNALQRSDEIFVRSLLIENLISRVRQHLAGISMSAPNGERRRELYSLWLEWLSSEQDAWTELAYDKSRGFWSLFEAKAIALLPEVQDLTPPADVPIANHSEELETLRNKLAEYQAEIDNLGRFRGLFFDLKGQLKDQQYDYEKLQQQLQHLLLNTKDGEDSLDLKQLNEHLKHKNQQLQNQLEAINADFEALFAIDNQPPSSVAAMPIFVPEQFNQMDAGITKIKHVVAAQNLEINEMTNIIHGLEIELEERNKLLNKMKEFEERTAEMETVVDVLEEENKYLQEQAKTFQSSMRGSLYDLEHKVNTLTQELKDKEEARHKLQRKYNDLESEYLEVYEKLHSLKK